MLSSCVSYVRRDVLSKIYISILNVGLVFLIYISNIISKKIYSNQDFQEQYVRLSSC